MRKRECCEEAGCNRHIPILIRLTPFTNRWVALTNYSVAPHPTVEGEVIIRAQNKHDVHNEVGACISSALFEILTGLNGIYKPEGVGKWLFADNDFLGGKPIDLLAQGKLQEVRDAIDTMNGMVAT